MKKNNSDETLKFKKKRSSDTIFTFKIISAIILVIVFLIFLLASSKTTSSDSYEIEEKGKNMLIVILYNIKEKFLFQFLVEEDIS